jgi:hypothetical protein
MRAFLVALTLAAPVHYKVSPWLSDDRRILSAVVFGVVALFVSYRINRRRNTPAL